MHALIIPTICLLLLTPHLYAQSFFIARLKYDGGGDWYNDPDAIPNLAQELNKRTNIKTELSEQVVSLNDEKLFQHPFIFMTGHGNINFSDAEVKRLRTYLANGGFLYADDDYGMDEAFRREIKKVFPDHELVELPHNHPIYNTIYNFPQGLPKIHEHYEGPPKGLGIFLKNRLVVYYTWNTNISDGWTQTHDNPYQIREQAFQMGINIVAYALSH
ncbi:MAG: DUF4159 domain-containing protein [Candidatus Latescibacteria bacterium]|nr:DUF4159 domain-containing protein [Candidatus Latescibacterota bacterium]